MANLSLFKTQENTAEFNIDLFGMKDVYDEMRIAKTEVGGEVHYRAKVAAGGGKSFEISTGNEETDVSVQTIAGIIVHNHKCNAYFDEDAVGNSPPICSSMDGECGLNKSTGEINQCKECILNEYGSSSKGAGKACKNMHRLYILTEGCAIPIALSLPPSSLKGWQNYRMSVLAMKKLKPHEVVTEFTLTAVTSPLGHKYSVVKFKLLGRLNDETKQIAGLFAQDVTKTTAAITGEDYNRLAPGKPEDISA